MKICLCKNSDDGKKTVGITGGLWTFDEAHLKRAKEILQNDYENSSCSSASLQGTITKNFHENPKCIDLMVGVSKLYDHYGLDKTAFVAGARVWYRKHFDETHILKEYLKEEAFRLFYDPTHL